MKKIRAFVRNIIQKEDKPVYKSQSNESVVYFIDIGEPLAEVVKKNNQKEIQNSLESYKELAEIT